MRLSYIIFLLIGVILFFNSCNENDSEEIKPEFIYATIGGVPDMDRNIALGDSVNWEIYYRIDDPDYSFNRLICEKLGSNSSYVEQFLFKVELIKIHEQRDNDNEWDVVIWKYLPTEIGSYNIEFFNVEDTLMKYWLKVEYPTFNYIMQAEDYQIIVDSVSNNPELVQYVDSYGTTEYYFGASSYFENFDLRISKRIDLGQTEFENLTEDEAKDLIWERIISSLELVLKANFPNANHDENFIIEFNTYENDLTFESYSAKFICNETDNKINFEFIEFLN